MFYGTLGGFTSSVRVINYFVRGGVNERSEAFIGAEMELEGTIRAFHYKDLKESLPPTTKTFASIEIEFTEDQQPSWPVENTDRPYIGTIQLRDLRAEENSDTDIVAFVRITLPFSMLQSLILMEGKSILFDTIQDFIDEPTPHQKQTMWWLLLKGHISRLQ